MYFDPAEATLFDVRDLLDGLGVHGAQRHMLIELFFAWPMRSWERHSTEEYFAEQLKLDTDAIGALLRDMARADLISCAQDIKSGRIYDIELGEAVVAKIRDRMKVAQEARARIRAARGPRPATASTKKQAHHMFEETCELCGDKAVKGKDQHGRPMQVARIKKVKDGTADNITLLCSGCSASTHSRDLPIDSRSLLNLQVAEERGYQVAPRTAAVPTKPLKEVVITATGPISVRTRTAQNEHDRCE